MESLNIKGAMDAVWSIIGYMDRSIQSNEPFKKINGSILIIIMTII